MKKVNKKVQMRFAKDEGLPNVAVKIMQRDVSGCVICLDSIHCIVTSI